MSLTTWKRGHVTNNYCTAISEFNIVAWLAILTSGLEKRVLGTCVLGRLLERQAGIVSVYRHPCGWVLTGPEGYRVVGGWERCEEGVW